VRKGARGCHVRRLRGYGRPPTLWVVGLSRNNACLYESDMLEVALDIILWILESMRGLCGSRGKVGVGFIVVCVS
jgi:hypothetical protein